MYSEFTKESKIIEKSEEEKNQELVDEIKNIKRKLECFYNNLRYADSDLIDYYTYQIKAEESKYNYLIKQAKKKKITLF